MNREISSRDLVRAATDRLRKAGSESPYLDATILLAHVWGVTRERLYALIGDSVKDDDAAAFEGLVQRRLAGEPVAYLVGYKEFFGHRFIVNRHVLVPRPDTELLVETALDLIPDRGPWKVHDCCTGSGCVAVSIAAERGETSVSMSDINEQTLEVAVRNSKAVIGRVLPNWKSDLLTCVPGRFNTITCNPPYLTDNEMAKLRSTETDRAAPARSPWHEPHEALSGGADGLEFVRRLIRDALASLASNGYIVIEIADAQAERVTDLLEAAGYRGVFVQRDLAGRRRVVGGQACSDISAHYTGTHG